MPHTGSTCLRGGRATYALRGGEYRDCQAAFTTGEKHITQGRQVPLIQTGHGTIYKDGTHDEVPFNDIKLLDTPSRPWCV